MTYVKWTFRVLIALIVFGFLHYTLPQREIVRITAVQQQRMELGENAWFFAGPDSGTATGGTGRDIKFIDAFRPSGRAIVFRNEDTGWGWPPYFKFNSFNVQAQAGDFISTSAAPRWVAVTHYGWRSEFFTIFPNVIGLRAVEGPDVTLIPWFNIAFFTVLGVLFLLARRMWMQFRERSLDPMIDNMGDALEAADQRADAARASAAGFFRRVADWFWRLIGR